MEASKEGETPGEESPESLPTEAGEERPKSKMMLAVIIAVIVVVAAIAAAFGLGLFGGEEEETNSAPTGEAQAVTGTTIDIGGSVTFESLAEDSDGTIVNYTWMYGDGDSDKSPTLNRTTHTYLYGGNYLIYHEVEDNDGATGSNEEAMISVYVIPWTTDTWANDTDPFAFMTVSENVIEINATVEFNMTSSAAPAWSDDEGQVVASWENISAMTLDFGDDSDVSNITPAALMTASHKYTASGHYASVLTVTSEADVSTKYVLTVHVLSPEATYEGNIKNPNAFIMVSIGEPDFLDPAVDYETAGGEVIFNTYETLVWYDGNSTATLIPVLATEIPTVENDGVTVDGMNYTFHLREGVTFHDGTDMNASDVAYSIQRVLRIHDADGPAWMIEQVFTNYLSFYIGDILGNYTADQAPPQWILDAIGETDPDYVLTEADMQAVAEAAITVVDDMTVNMRLTKPFSAFLSICAYTVMSIVSMDYVEDNGGITNGDHNEVMDETVCGTGPYLMPEGGWEFGTKVHLERNDNYWGDAPALKDIYLITATDENTRILMLQSGDADCIALSIEYESLFAGDPDYEITKGLATFDMTFAGFNMNIDEVEAATYGSDVPSDFFADKNIRLAFVYMFDYQTFIDNVLFGNGRLANGAIPYGMFGYDGSVPSYEFDLDAVKTYLQAAINPDTSTSYWDTGFSIALFYNSGNTYRETACRYLEDALDELTTMAAGDTDAVFTASVNELAWPTYLAALRSAPSPFPVFFLGWAPDYADPDDYVTPFLDSVYGTYTHYTGYVNTSIDDLIREAAVELDPTTRADLYAQVTQLVYEDAPYMWLYQANNFHIQRSWVNGYYFNPMYPGLYYPSMTKG